MGSARAFALAILALSLPACSGERRSVLPPGLYWTESPTFADTAAFTLDILVVIDDSAATRDEQASLVAGVSGFIADVTMPPDGDGDHVPDWYPVQELHLGVISGDMGAPGQAVAGCDELGDDGILNDEPSPAVPGCDADYPQFLDYDLLAPDPDVGSDFECIGTLGTDGCGFQQPFAAIQKALTVHSARGEPNEGFLRVDANLAILIVTAGDDCSAGDPSLFGDTGSPEGVRCFENQERLLPLDEAVEGILSVKPGRPDRIVVAAIAGVPSDLVALSEADLESEDVQTAEDFERILADPRMVEAVDESAEGGGERLVPSCDVPGAGVAFPPRRIVSLVRDIDRQGNGGIVQSSCGADWQPALRALARLLASKAHPMCLSRAILGRNGVPLVTGDRTDCIMRETLSDDRRCGPGRIPAGSDDGRTVCQVCQVGDGEDPYSVDLNGTDVTACAGSDRFWFYSTDDPDCAGSGLIEFAQDAEPSRDSTIRIECVHFLPT